MRCETCRGLATAPPCPSCGGSGIGSCCEGMVGGPLEPANCGPAAGDGGAPPAPSGGPAGAGG